MRTIDLRAAEFNGACYFLTTFWAREPEISHEESVSGIKMPTIHAFCLNDCNLHPTIFIREWPFFYQNSLLQTINGLTRTKNGELNHTKAAMLLATLVHWYWLKVKAFCMRSILNFFSITTAAALAVVFVTPSLNA